MYLQRSIFSPFFLSFGGGSQPGRNGSNQAVGAQERESREGGCSEFLGKAGSEGGKVGFRELGRQGFCKMTVSKLGKASAFFVWGEDIVLQLSQCSNISSRVTLENSLYLSELSPLIGLRGSSQF